jgi:hypothetical protein
MNLELEKELKEKFINSPNSSEEIKTLQLENELLKEEMRKLQHPSEYY